MIIIIISILAILGWTSIFNQTFTTKEGFRYKYYFARTLISSMDVKPFNCAYCLSFWVGLTLSICLLDISYMVIFLYFARTKD
jgi:hypothetical protein